jgi:hypothetical protein
MTLRSYREKLSEADLREWEDFARAMKDEEIVRLFKHQCPNGRIRNLPDHLSGNSTEKTSNYGNVTGYNAVTFTVTSNDKP